jgi:hypothetical protein
MIGGAVFSIFARLLALAELEQMVGPNLRRRAQEVISAGASAGAYTGSATRWR